MRSLDDPQPEPMQEPGQLERLTPPDGNTKARGVTPTPWTLRQMLIGAAATLIPWLTFSIGSSALLGPSSAATSSKPPSVALDAISGVIIFVVSALLEAIFLIAPVVVVYSRRLPRASFRERMRWLGFRATPLAPAVGVVVVGLAIGLGGSLVYSQLVTALHLPLQTNTETLLKEGQSAPLTTLGILASASLAAPFCEEVFFRGFVFTGLLKRMPLWPAALLSAVIFGVAHADLGSLVPLIIIGVALAWARWRTDSIWPGIVIHAANNTAAAVLLLPLLLK